MSSTITINNLKGYPVLMSAHIELNAYLNSSGGFCCCVSENGTNVAGIYNRQCDGDGHVAETAKMILNTYKDDGGTLKITSRFPDNWHKFSAILLDAEDLAGFRLKFADNMNASCPGKYIIE